MATHTRRASVLLLSAVSTAAFALAGCGQAGSSGTEAPATVSGAGCAPVAGEQLVVLEDDKHLQNADNVIAVANAKAASPALLAAVNKVGDALDTPKLVALNKAVEVDRKTSQVAAQDFAAQAGLTSGLSGGNGPVVVGAANFPESRTLAELYKIALDAAGFKATVQTTGNRELYEAALERGELTVFPEYAATLTEFLNQKQNGKDAAPKASGDIDATVTALKELATKAGLAVGTPSKAADQNAYAVTKAFADQHQLKTLSDFAAKCSGTASILAGPAECPERPFCQPGLDKTYGIKFGSFLQADAGGAQTKTALTTGKATLGTVFSSDGTLVPNS